MVGASGMRVILTLRLLQPREVGRRFEALSRGHMRGERLRTSQVHVGVVA